MSNSTEIKNLLNCEFIDLCKLLGMADSLKRKIGDVRTFTLSVDRRILTLPQYWALEDLGSDYLTATIVQKPKMDIAYPHMALNVNGKMVLHSRLSNRRRCWRICTHRGFPMLNYFCCIQAVQGACNNSFFCYLPHNWDITPNVDLLSPLVPAGQDIDNPVFILCCQRHSSPSYFFGKNEQTRNSWDLKCQTSFEDIYDLVVQYLHTNKPLWNIQDSLEYTRCMSQDRKHFAYNTIVYHSNAGIHHDPLC